MVKVVRVFWVVKSSHFTYSMYVSGCHDSDHCKFANNTPLVNKDVTSLQADLYWNVCLQNKYCLLLSGIKGVFYIWTDIVLNCFDFEIKISTTIVCMVVEACPDWLWGANSEANASELLENREEMFPRYW